MSGSADFTIGEAAEAAGCTPEELRTWGVRYGWPQPSRNRIGWRVFSPAIVAVLRRVVALRDSGMPIGSIIGTGVPILPDDGHHAATPVDLSRLPEPAGLDGRDLCLALASSIRRGLTPAEVRHIAEVRLSRVHPSDRAAVLALVERYEQQRPAGSAA